MSFLYPRTKSYGSIVSESSTRHQEHHFENPRVISDIIIGLSDGLTVPFALMAGLSSLGNSIVIAGGLAELISGAISMGLGGYLAASSEAKHYANERKREEREIVDCPEEEEEEIFEALAPYGVTRESCQPVIECLRKNPKGWVDFMMKFELGLEETGMRTAWVSAGTIGISYFLGGLIPMLPYFFIKNALHGLWVSIVVTAIALLIFGYVKSSYIVSRRSEAVVGSFQALVVGGAAAMASWGIVRLMEH